jgi:Holliday junction resolvase
MAPGSDTGSQEPPLARMPRDPARFDVADLFAELDSEKTGSVHDPERHEVFVAKVSDGLRHALGGEAAVHGLIVENMFREVVRSLGTARLIKKEDVGSVHTSGPVVVPDYRIATASGNSLLIEVKSCNKTTGAFSMRVKEIEGLKRYRELMGNDIHVAVHWRKWNLWTLTPLEAFERVGPRMSITLPAAARANRMGVLGDVMLFTSSPLRLTLVADESRPRRFTSKEVMFTVGAVAMHARGVEIEDVELVPDPDRLRGSNPCLDH